MDKVNKSFPTLELGTGKTGKFGVYYENDPNIQSADYRYRRGLREAKRLKVSDEHQDRAVAEEDFDEDAMLKELAGALNVDSGDEKNEAGDEELDDMSG